MSSRTVIVAFAGPPPVNRNGSRKTWAVPMIWRMSVTSSTPRSCGSVTCQTFCADRGAVDLGRVVQLGRHATQGGQVDDDGGRRRRPRSPRGPATASPSPRSGARAAGPTPEPAEDRVEDARRAAVEEEASRAAPRRPAARRPAGRRGRCSSAAAPAHLAHEHGQHDRDRDSRRRAPAGRTRAVFVTAVQNSGSCQTRAKLSRPTKTGVETRFVSWTLMTTARSDRQPGEDAEDRPGAAAGTANVLRPSRVTPATGHAAGARRRSRRARSVTGVIRRLLPSLESRALRSDGMERASTGAPTRCREPPRRGAAAQSASRSAWTWAVGARRGARRCRRSCRSGRPARPGRGPRTAPGCGARAR